nr:hypothetical protein [uncultured Alistipes sp.]
MSPTFFPERKPTVEPFGFFVGDVKNGIFEKTSRNIFQSLLFQLHRHESGEVLARRRRDSEMPGIPETELSVIIRISEQHHGPKSHSSGFAYQILDQGRSDSPAPEFGRDSQRTETKHFETLVATGLDLRPRTYCMAHYTTVRFGHDIQLRHETRRPSHTMYDQMFVATGAIDIPERTADQSFDPLAILFSFGSNDKTITHDNK